MEQQDRIDQLVAENQELLALTKQAFIKREVENESVPVDEEWQKFAAEHADELEALEKDEPRTATITRLMGILPYKVAASYEFQIRPNHPWYCRQIPSRRTRQPTRSPLFSTM